MGETSEGIEGIRPGSIPSKASGTKEFLLRREPNEPRVGPPGKLDVRSHDRITAGGGGFFSPKDFPERAFGLGLSRRKERDLWWPELFLITRSKREE